MGQKVNPISFRLGISRDWQARWFNEKDYSQFLIEDEQIRKLIKDRYSAAGIAEVYIERPAKNVMRVMIKSARPGILIGKKGVEIKGLREELAQKTGKNVDLNIEEVKNPEIMAQLVAENIAYQIERRVSFKHAMKRAISRSLSRGAKGVKISISGRLNGAEIARTVWYREGRVPLHTLRADIDYGFTLAITKYGQLGVKVWIFREKVHQPTASTDKVSS